MWQIYMQQHPRFGTWYRRVERQPSWVVKAAVTLAVLTIVVPLALLTLAALAVGLIAFTVLGLVSLVVGSVRQLFAGGGASSTVPRFNDGRRNVRVIDRPHS